MDTPAAAATDSRVTAPVPPRLSRSRSATRMRSRVPDVTARLYRPDGKETETGRRPPALPVWGFTRVRLVRSGPSAPRRRPFLRGRFPGPHADVDGGARRRHVALGRARVVRGRRYG